MEMGYEYTVGKTLLRAENVNVQYGKTSILKDVNFEIHDIVRPNQTQGQVVALLAPSGTGKTQLFRTIAGLQKPTSGAVYLNGNTTPVHAGQVGVVAQDYPLWNHMSVLENLLMGIHAPKLQGQTPKQAALAFLASIGLSDKANCYPRELSGGQRQRIAIGQQTLGCGHLLLMDEPFSGLDIIAKETVQHLIAEVAASDDLNSIIVTTHDIRSALAIADTVLLLGRDRDAQGQYIPGAYIKDTINLIDEGLAWHPGITNLPAFSRIEKEIVAKFRNL